MIVQELIKRGEIKGEIKGKIEGEIKGKIETARNMKKEGFSLDVISRITGLDLDVLKEHGIAES